jgi:protocatechuate 3,4-dioxygenase beta subunit/bacterioferritin-associated ferredoxin
LKIHLEKIKRMSDVICVCNGVWEDDLKDYLRSTPISSIDELRAKERICNKCRQCEPLVSKLITEVLAETKSGPSRRQSLLALGGLALSIGMSSASLLTTRKASAQQAATPPCGKQTPQQMEGPFFTPLSPERTNLIEPGMRAPSLRIVGRVVDLNCRPLHGALLDFWQTDDLGRYDNKGYLLRGHQYSNAKGEFRLDTLIPGEYPGRTPHFHVKVQHKSGPVLTTQLYLPSHPRNTRDFLFDPKLVLSSRGSELQFQFVLAS